MIALAWPNRSLRPAVTDRRWLDRAAALMEDPSVPAADRLPVAVSRATALLQMGEEAGWAALAVLPEDAGTSQEISQMGRRHLNAGDAAVQWGRYAEARRKLEAALRLAGQHDYARMRDIALATLAHLDWFTGDWAGLAGRAATLAGLDDLDPLVRLEAVLVAGLVDAATGACEAGEQRLRLVLEESRRRGVMDMPLEPSAALARLRLAEERPRDALGLTDEPVQVIMAKGVWLWATDVAPARVQALTAVGRTGEAAKLVTAFARGLHGRNMPAPRAALALCRAILADSGEGRDRTAALFARAAAAFEALPRPYDALLARERQAGCLLAAGQHQEGTDLLSQVFTGLSDLRAAGDAERVAARLRGHGVEVRRVHPGGRPGYGDQLSPRELEVVRLVAAGQTNREIARALVLSPKTVARHVDSARRKLKVPSRTALAVDAIESGIISGSRAVDP
jgi:DNA-binding CsgD family transcriptional regulator